MVRARLVAAIVVPSLAIAGLAVTGDPAPAVTTVSVSAATAADTVTVKVEPRKASHLSIHKKRVNEGDFKWLVIATLTRAGHPYAHQRVYLEAHNADVAGWTVIASDKTTKQGVVGWRFKPIGLRWRFKYEGNNETKPSISAAFHAGRPRVVGDRTDLSSLGELVRHGWKQY
jgi:hypothetical protein